MERIWHHYKPDKRRPPTKTHRPGKEGINQRCNKDTKDNTEGAAKSTAEMGVSAHRTTLSHSLHRAGLYGRLARKKPLLKEKKKKHVWSLPNSMWQTPQTHGRRFSGQMRLKLIFLAIMGNAMCGANPTPWEHHSYSEAWWWQHHAVGMFFICRDRKAGQDWRKDGWH